MKVINLTRGFKTIVDDCDYALVSCFKWHARINKNKVYAARTLNSGQKIFLHRLILGLDRNRLIEADHINGDGLDNRRSNLRACSRVENCRNLKKRSDNTSGFKGVQWDKERKRWTSIIYINGKLTRIGRFLKKLDAVNAYDKKAKEEFGEFANPNIQEVK